MASSLFGRETQHLEANRVPRPENRVENGEPVGPVAKVVEEVMLGLGLEEMPADTRQQNNFWYVPQVKRLRPPSKPEARHADIKGGEREDKLVDVFDFFCLCLDSFLFGYVVELPFGDAIGFASARSYAEQRQTPVSRAYDQQTFKNTHLNLLTPKLCQSRDVL